MSYETSHFFEHICCDAIVEIGVPDATPVWGRVLGLSFGAVLIRVAPIHACNKEADERLRVWPLLAEILSFILRLKLKHRLHPIWMSVDLKVSAILTSTVKACKSSRYMVNRAKYIIAKVLNLRFYVLSG